MRSQCHQSPSGFLTGPVNFIDPGQTPSTVSLALAIITIHLQLSNHNSSCAHMCPNANKHEYSAWFPWFLCSLCYSPVKNSTSSSSSMLIAHCPSPPVPLEPPLLHPQPAARVAGWRLTNEEMVSAGGLPYALASPIQWLPNDTFRWRRQHVVPGNIHVHCGDPMAPPGLGKYAKKKTYIRNAQMHICFKKI